MCCNIYPLKEQKCNPAKIEAIYIIKKSDIKILADRSVVFKRKYGKFKRTITKI